jgi:hypothetical protein
MNQLETKFNNEYETPHDSSYYVQQYSLQPVKHFDCHYIPQSMNQLETEFTHEILNSYQLCSSMHYTIIL